MKVSDFVDFVADQSPGTLRKNIEKNYPKIGAGFFSTVFDMGDGRVIKVNDLKDKHTENYVKLAIKNQNNQHFPKIFAVRQVWWGPSYRILIVMEKLSPVKATDTDVVASQFYARWISRGDSMLPAWLDKMLSSMPEEKAEAAAKEIETKFPSIAKTITSIKLNDIDAVLDIMKSDGHDNMMRRNDGTLVFTDPVA